MVIELQNNDVGGSASSAVPAVPCLRRLPNVYDRAIELPLSARADVKIYNSVGFYCFVASSTGLADGQVQLHLIRYSPSMIKLIVGEPGVAIDDLELDRWRFRLPQSTRPELTSVFCKDGVLIVIVPKIAT